ncbi:hypothetical protein GQ43DRAFT_111501 [Delitschia confertaspora ATCC 74209]|uniref:Integral membrane protein n=1 Tax=Delitschia confertaspora ATCC 74209 TaxID=1513339 RepID=A0A9P4JI82_9PLEO|nr:hypothetical protein GQ43DRAFT_111501 [Delitschia confertaspora ATCC 74209]
MTVPPKPRGRFPVQLAKPLLKAYLLGLVSSTAPRIIKVLVLAAKGKLDHKSVTYSLASIIQKAVAWYRFPAFCGVLVGGSTLLQAPISVLMVALSRILQSSHKPISRKFVERFSRLVSAFLSAFVSFWLLNSTATIDESYTISSIEKSQNKAMLKSSEPFRDPPETALQKGKFATKAPSLQRRPLAGKTMDLTLFAAIRALDITITSLWSRARILSENKKKLISRTTPLALFCFSAATIMHAWFYTPSRLPRTYNRWISTAADLDRRLLLALRHARYGTFIYGKDTGMRPLLGSLARDLGLPEIVGDPAETVPVPCELVHMGYAKSCEGHALLRFFRGWLFAAKMYAPLQLVTLLRKARSKGISWSSVVRATVDMARSSSFLGGFIALFYYGVCLSRTRLGPKLFSRRTVSAQAWDSGLCVLGGCILCGFSMLLEHQRKRLEILFFVLPRAAATWLPRYYLREDRWKEHLVFTLSTAIVFTTAQEDPRRVRGMLGNVLNGILKVK